MQQQSILRLISVVVLINLAIQVEAQIFDQLSNVGTSNPGAQPPIGSRLRDIFSVNVPIFYDMVKNGNSMGINVLQGLVKVERGEEAERSGLQGPRPLSVRVFGVPVYERGTRVRNPEPAFSGVGGREPNVHDDALPI